MTPRPSLADRLRQPFLRFFELEAASAGLLFATTVAALAWANSPFAESYEHFWHAPLALQVGSWRLEMSLAHFVNEALMALFFFVVGLEIKRELVHGELSTRRQAALPVAAALGGMVAPALIYAALQGGGPAASGWGIPMATDIAFAVAALSLLGVRVPPALKVFLLALAIADDLGAVAVIALFYAGDLSLGYLGAAIAGLAGVYGMSKAGVRASAAYWIAGGMVWYLVLQSGVHATLAGVCLGFLTPAVPPDPRAEGVLERAQRWSQQLVDGVRGEDHHGAQRHRAVRELRRVGRDALSPLDYLAHELDDWVAFAVMPIFALANAGVRIDAGTLTDPAAQGVGLAVALGLLLGKPIGITLFSVAAVRSGLAELPRGVGWTAIFASGALAGIGFTVALFITNLAFTDPDHTAGAKLGILVASTLAAGLGIGLLWRALPPSSAA